MTNVDPLSKGMMDFVSSDHGIAKDLRKYVIFKFFPVVCPDGVFLGNSRCTLLGADLNRPVHVLLSRFYPKFIQIKFGSDEFLKNPDSKEKKRTPGLIQI